MDWLTFISQMAAALAWPTVVVVLLFLVRPYFGGLAARLESLKLPGGTEAKFREELARAKVDVQALQQRTASVRTHDATPDLGEFRQKNEEYLELSRNFPEAAIMYSFQEVERVFDEIAPRLDIPRGHPQAVIEALQRRELIDRQLRDLYQRLSNLRNVAVHRGAVTLTQDEALQYRDLARAAAFQLRGIRERLKGGGQ
jgi:hypothetical protein